VIANFLTLDTKRINLLRVDELKDLSMLYYKTMKQYIRYKYMYKSQMSLIFPELGRDFCLHRTKGVPYMLLKYPTPKDIINASYNELRQALTEKLIVKHYYTPEYIDKIVDCAKKSIGIEKYPPTCFQWTIRIMLFYQEVTDDIKKRLKKLLKETDYYSLLDEFGYNVPSLATIIGQIGDIRRFASYKKFVKYCGYDVSVKQSGGYNSVNCYITKHGNKQLRHIFYAMVLTYLAKKDNHFHACFERLKEKGKHPTQAMVAVARKLAIKAYWDMHKCH